MKIEGQSPYAVHLRELMLQHHSTDCKLVGNEGITLK